MLSRQHFKPSSEEQYKLEQNYEKHLARTMLCLTFDLTMVQLLVEFKQGATSFRNVDVRQCGLSLARIRCRSNFAHRPSHGFLQSRVGMVQFQVVVI